jgi:hypothetical protein
MSYALAHQKWIPPSCVKQDVYRQTSGQNLSSSYTHEFHDDRKLEPLDNRGAPQVCPPREYVSAGEQK